MKEINVDLGKLGTHTEQLTLIKNDPEGQKDVWLEIFGLSAADGFTVEVGTYKQDDKPFHYWEICHKGRVFVHLVPYQGTDDYVLSEMWVCIGTAKIDWYYNNVFDLQIFIFDNNLVVAYVSGNIQNAIDKGMIIIPPNDTALEFGQIRYDMYSVGISLEGILGTIDFHGGRGTNVTAPQKTLYEYFQDAIMTSPSTPTRKTRDNGTLVLRDFSLCGSDFVPHVVENMWMICSMPTALLTQKFIKLNGTKHMIIRSKKDSQQSWFLLANTGEEYTGSNEENSW
jgi:hypothetical protein